VQKKQVKKKLPMLTFHNFPCSSDEFHSGEINLWRYGKKVLVMVEFHLYEGYNAWSYLRRLGDAWLRRQLIRCCRHGVIL
jgi:hypothetical protein